MIIPPHKLGICESEGCNKGFIPTRSTARFCSRECKNKPFVCIDCGISVSKTRCRRCAKKEINSRPGHKEKLSKNVKKSLWEPKTRQRMLSALKKNAANKAIREKRRVTMNTEEFKDKHSKLMKEICQRPDVKENHTRAMRSPESRQRKSVSNKRAHTQPEIKRKYLCSLQSESYKKSQSETMLRLWNDKDYIEKVLSGKAKNYGGQFVGQKYIGFDAVRELIRNRDDNKCQICDSKNNIQVHHIDFDNNNQNPQNLVSLCRTCHRIHTHRNRGTPYGKNMQLELTNVAEKNTERMNKEWLNQYAAVTFRTNIGYRHRHKEKENV